MQIAPAAGPRPRACADPRVRARGRGSSAGTGLRDRARLTPTRPCSLRIHTKMDDKKKRRSPKPCLSQPAPPTSALRRVPVPTSRSASFSLGLPHLPSPKQRTKFKRVTKEKCRPVIAGGGGAPAGTPLQHSFLTEVTGVYEMEGGLLNLLNDFHSGRLQAFGKECSFEQLEHVREMQEKLARLHFSLDVCGEEEEEEDETEAEGLPQEQKKTVADRNLDQLLSNLEDLSNSIQKLHLAENADPEEAPTA